MNPMNRIQRANRLPRALLGLALWACAAACATAWAGVPGAYAPSVLQPTVIANPAPNAATSPTPAAAPNRWEFDLTAVLKRAQTEKKRLYVYLGADDCPYCRAYEAFLDKNAGELVPQFAKDYLVVDLRSTLKAQSAKLFFRVGDKVMNYSEFQQSLGDERARQLVYPSVWLWDGKGKNLMQMPAGAGTFMTVPEQLEILRLEQ
jgi:thioredoxin-related protein